ncbi:MAG: FAD/NAD(P)-binding protein [bacterium]
MTNESKEYKKVEVISTNGQSPSVRSIRFKFTETADGRDFTFVPGQFIMVSIPGFGESPLTITTSPSSLPEFEIAVRSVGNNTFAINRLSIGDTAYIKGPLGNNISFQEIYGRELVIIAGGIGIAPLMSIVRQIKENQSMVSKLTFIYGAKTPDDLLFKGELAIMNKIAETYITVDKADKEWQGLSGFIPDIVKKVEITKDATVIICGPSIMYQSTSDVLIKKGLKKENINLMFERRMKCGIGKCQHCTCGKLYVCTDGPTFTLAQIEDNWEAFL